MNRAPAPGMFSGWMVPLCCALAVRQTHVDERDVNAMVGSLQGGGARSRRFDGIILSLENLREVLDESRIVVYQQYARVRVGSLAHGTRRKPTANSASSVSATWERPGACWIPVRSSAAGA